MELLHTPKHVQFQDNEDLSKCIIPNVEYRYPGSNPGIKSHKYLCNIHYKVSIIKYWFKMFVSCYKTVSGRLVILLLVSASSIFGNMNIGTMIYPMAFAAAAASFLSLIASYLSILFFVSLKLSASWAAPCLKNTSSCPSVRYLKIFFLTLICLRC